MDLQQYPKILSYIKAVQILRQDNHSLQVRITVGLRTIQFSYTCEISYKKGKWLAIVSHESIFKQFSSICTFEKIGDDKTLITYQLDAKFANPFIEFLATAALPLQAAITMRAFNNYLDQL